MATRYKGVRMGGAIKPTNMGNMRVQKAVDFIELAERGLITETHEQTSTSGIGHKKSGGKFGSSIGAQSVDMGKIGAPQATPYDYGSITTDVYSEPAYKWSSRREFASSRAQAPAPSGPWTVNLANVTYDNVSLSVSSQDDNACDIAFNTDGTKMYMVGYASDNVNQYTLSTGFDLSTASYDSVSFSVSSQDAVPFAIAFNTDGTKMYIVGYMNDTIYQYSLSTGFDLSTASYGSVSLNVSSQDATPLNLTFNTDGTKMYMVGMANDNVYQYSLSTGFDLSTASYDSVSFSVASQDTIPSGIAFNPDGTKMYLVANVNDNVHQYTLSTGFDLSTASHDSVSFNVNSQENNPYGLAFSTDGTKMYLVGNENDTVYQYSTGL